MGHVSRPRHGIGRSTKERQSNHHKTNSSDVHISSHLPFLQLNARHHRTTLRHNMRKHIFLLPHLLRVVQNISRWKRISKKTFLCSSTIEIVIFIAMREYARFRLSRAPSEKWFEMENPLFIIPTLNQFQSTRLSAFECEGKYWNILDDLNAFAKSATDDMVVHAIGASERDKSASRHSNKHPVWDFWFCCSPQREKIERHSC